MPPRTAQCCRALQRTSQTRRDRFGISDAILVAIFEHYSSAAKTQVRHGSFVPGPFENRRRDGRRRMGELRLGQTSGSAAPWDLENVPDLTQWRWSPPSSAVGRISRYLRDGHPSLLKTVLTSTLHPFSTLWGAVNAIIHPATLSIHQTGASPLDFVELGFAQISRDLSRDPSLRSTPKFVEFCHHLEHALASGHLRASDATLVFSNLHQGLSALASEHLYGTKALEQTQCLVLVLIKAIANGVSSRNNSGHAVFDTQLFSGLLSAVSVIQQRDATILASIMACIPAHCMSNLSREIHAVLENYFFASVMMHESDKITTSQVDQLAEAWLALDSNQHLAILNMATETALEHLHSSIGSFKKVRLAWLSLLARLPDVSMEYLARACAFTEAGNHTPPLPSDFLCKVFLTQIDRSQSSTLDTDNAAHAWQQKRGHGSGSFVSLGRQLADRSDIVNLLRAAKFLTLGGRDQNVIQLLHGAKRAFKASNGAARINGLPLLDLAFACESPAIVIEVLETCVRHPSARDEKFWESEESLASLLNINAVQKTSRTKVLKALRLDRAPCGRATATGPDVQVQKAIRLAEAAVASAAKSRRSSFETVFHCVNYVRKHRGVVPSSLLRCVHELVKTDLAAGRLGVQARLKWYLDLVGMKSGPEIQMRTGQALQRWREHNRELTRHKRLVV
ncbi:hypothetical protein Micbo1qcDRAFT_157519 [Microdochium bolleyi]|uniref:Uncharacterized protein n=1 Tax=Microdochium bolleyi TaxID=196109 RepID=A0A136JEG7_9PEZI|nr:hypothetical protein Micbo1qcDRAFT_157519 [Microdochium bolleyi]